jgi:hypothetical protein
MKYSDLVKFEPIELPRLSRPTLEAATRLVGYFKSHARRVYGKMSGSYQDGGEDVVALVRWIIRNGKTGFSTRDISRNFDRFRDDPGALGDALLWMLSKNVLRHRVEANSPPRGGRKPAPYYEVNPDLLDSPRFRHFRRSLAS